MAKKKRKKMLKTIKKTVIFSVQVWVYSGYRFSIFFSLFNSGSPKSPKIPVFPVLIRLQFYFGSGSLIFA